MNPRVPPADRLAATVGSMAAKTDARPTMFVEDLIGIGDSHISDGFMDALEAVRRILPSRCSCARWSPPQHDLTSPHFACGGRGYLLPDTELPSGVTAFGQEDRYWQDLWQMMGILE